MISEPAACGTGLHATAMIYGESGVLILGPAGSGKSALALALMARAHDTRMFAALVGDDRVYVRPAGGRLVANCVPHQDTPATARFSARGRRPRALGRRTPQDFAR